MPRLRDRGVLNLGLTGPQLLWEQEGFALADGYDDASGKFRALVLPTDGMAVTVSDATLIVQPERAKAQRAAEVPDESPVGVDGFGSRAWPRQTASARAAPLARRDSSAASGCSPTAMHRTSRSSPTRSSARSAPRPG